MEPMTIAQAPSGVAVVAVHGVNEDEDAEGAPTGAAEEVEATARQASAHGKSLKSGNLTGKSVKSFESRS